MSLHYCVPKPTKSSSSIWPPPGAPDSLLCFGHFTGIQTQHCPESNLLPSMLTHSSSFCVVYLTQRHYHSSEAAAAKSLQSYPTLCNPTDGSPPGSPVPGILQARTLEWVAISFSNAWKWKVKVKSLSHVQLATPWTAAHQAPPSMGFSSQEYWSGGPLPSPSSEANCL